MTAPRRILCLHWPNWPIQRRLAANPQLDPARPLVLHTRDPRRGELAATCNGAALRSGVRPGMPLAEAATLLGREHEAALVPHEPAADLAALQDLAERCERFSPWVGWETVEPGGALAATWRPALDWLLLDATGIGPLFGGEEPLARAALADLRQLGYAARLAIAPTVGAAWALACGGSEAICLCHEIQAAVAPLPLAALRLPAATVELLGQLGIVRIEQLATLPRESLTARFGPLLLWRLDQLAGAVSEAIVPHRPPPPWVAEKVLDDPAQDRWVLERVLASLVQSLAKTLAERGIGAAQLQIRLDCVPGRPVLLGAGLFQPSAEPRHLTELVRMQLEAARLPGPVGRITLAVTRTARLASRQRELFAGDDPPPEPRHLASLIDRLSSRLGPAAVVRPELTADLLPERAVRYRPLVESAARRGPAQTTTFAPWQRPLTLLPTPIPLEVVSVVPDGPPAAFRRQGRPFRIARHWGPERIEAGWWRGRSVRRDYYRVELADGRRLWIFRRLDDGGWFLHGEFS
jgi:protein ImuB